MKTLKGTKTLFLALFTIGVLSISCTTDSITEEENLLELLESDIISFGEADGSGGPGHSKSSFDEGMGTGGPGHSMSSFNEGTGTGGPRHSMSSFDEGTGTGGVGHSMSSFEDGAGSGGPH